MYNYGYRILIRAFNGNYKIEYYHVWPYFAPLYYTKYLFCIVANKAVSTVTFSGIVF